MHPSTQKVSDAAQELGLEVEILGLIDLYYGRAHIDGADIVILYTGRLTGGTPAPADDVDAVAFFEPDELPELAFASTREILTRWKPG